MGGACRGADHSGGRPMEATGVQPACRGTEVHAALTAEARRRHAAGSTHR